VRTVLATLIVGISLIIASFSWSGFGVLRTTLNPDKSEDLADELISNPAVRDYLVDRIGDSIEAEIPDGIDINREDIDNATANSIDDSEISKVLKDGFIALHKQVLEGETNPVELDGTALGSAGINAIAEDQPVIAALIPADLDLEVSIPTDSLGFVSRIRSLLKRVVPIGALVSLAGTTLGFAVARNRSKVLRRVGYWAFGASAFWLIVGIGLPKLLGLTTNEAAPIGSAIVSILFGSMVQPAIFLAILGIILIALSIILPKTERIRNLDGATKQPRQPNSINSAGADNAYNADGRMRVGERYPNENYNQQNYDRNLQQSRERSSQDNYRNDPRTDTRNDRRDDRRY